MRVQKQIGYEGGRRRAMRLVLIGPVYPYRGGIAHFTTMLYRALRERKHKVLLVSFKRQYPRWLFPGKTDKDPSQQPLKVEEAKYWIDSLNPITWLATFWRINEYKPDALILQWWTTFWAPAWCVLALLHRVFLRKDLLVICHNVLPHEARWWNTLLAKCVLRWGTAFTVQSKDEERLLLSLLPEARTTIAPLPPFSMFASQRIPKERARQQLGLPAEVPVLLFFGLVREYKGLEDLLNALPEVQAQVGRVILVVAGEFWDEKLSYLETIQRLGIEETVVIDDRYIPNEEVGVYFSATDVLVAPYRRVTGSAVVQMARAFGVPTITTQAGAELGGVDDQTRPVTPPGDSQALAVAIIHHLVERPKDEKIGMVPHDQKINAWNTLIDVIEDTAAEL